MIFSIDQNIIHRITVILTDNKIKYFLSMKIKFCEINSQFLQFRFGQGFWDSVTNTTRISFSLSN